jgi:phosphoribosylformimino-5-aminoimidazole carboxamide ribotide isomerase
MIVAPAVDLRGGRCVQLVGGRPEEERVSLPDPLAVAERWWANGFHLLHLVDLDAALGSGDNLPLLRGLLVGTPAVTQVGGGVRDTARADLLLEAGADRVIVGTRAIDDPAWLTQLAHRHPGRVVVAADTRDGKVLRKGWTEAAELPITELLDRIAPLPLAGVLTTDVGREGRMEGMDRKTMARTLEWRAHPVWASGGVSSEDDLEWLEQHGAEGAVLGMALYTGALDAARVAERWGAAWEGATHEKHEGWDDGEDDGADDASDDDGETT